MRGPYAALQPRRLPLTAGMSGKGVGPGKVRRTTRREVLPGPLTQAVTLSKSTCLQARAFLLARGSLGLQLQVAAGCPSAENPSLALCAGGGGRMTVARGGR